MKTTNTNQLYKKTQNVENKEDFDEIKVRRDIGYGEDLLFKVFPNWSKRELRRVKTKRIFQFKKTHKHFSRNLHLINDIDSAMDGKSLSFKSLFDANKHAKDIIFKDGRKIKMVGVGKTKEDKCYVRFYSINANNENETYVMYEELFINALQYLNFKVIRSDKQFNDWDTIEKHFNVKIVVIPKSYVDKDGKKIGNHNTHAERYMAKISDKLNDEKLTTKRKGKIRKGFGRFLRKFTSHEVIPFLNELGKELYLHEKSDRLIVEYIKLKQLQKERVIEKRKPQIQKIVVKKKNK